MWVGTEDRLDLILDGYRWRGVGDSGTSLGGDGESEALSAWLRAVCQRLPRRRHLLIEWTQAIPHVYGSHPCVYRDGPDPGPCLVARVIANELHDKGWPGLGYRDEWKP
jgi:hypothetical protein